MLRIDHLIFHLTFPLPLSTFLFIAFLLFLIVVGAKPHWALLLLSFFFFPSLFVCSECRGEGEAEKCNSGKNGDEEISVECDFISLFVLDLNFATTLRGTNIALYPIPLKYSFPQRRNGIPLLSCKAAEILCPYVLSPSSFFPLRHSPIQSQTHTLYFLLYVFVVPPPFPFVLFWLFLVCRLCRNLTLLVPLLTCELHLLFFFSFVGVTCDETVSSAANRVERGI